MPDILIKNIPSEVHERLKVRARKNRRPMAQELLVILDSTLQQDTRQFPAPVAGNKPLTQNLVTRGIRGGRL
ncbi:MAG TPA: Arc family DNA-binding protein [bacterium]|nr:Arc family DNA-binding protein [bacterium]